MCFSYSVNTERQDIEERFHAAFSEDFVGIYKASAYEFPRMPVITEYGKIRLLEWGLIPHWATDEGIRKNTFNARAEDIFERPSFRKPIRDKRCIIIANGFFEWHHRGDKKFPYYIRLKDGELFGMAGIWDRWQGRDTFSLITTEANPLIAEIHNTKKRMPVILENEMCWLDGGLTEDDIKGLLTPYPEDKMEAWPVGRSGNVPEALERVSYPELEQQKKLF